MKKKILAALLSILCIACIAFTCTACGASTKEESLTYVRNTSGDDLYTSNVVDTEEGVSIFCTSNYVLGPNGGSDGKQFLFLLKDWSEECLEDDYDWSTKFVSNGNIYKTDFYDYQNNLIATEECNGMVSVDQDYKDGTYIDRIVMHIEYEGKLFTAEFIRSGA